MELRKKAQLFDRVEDQQTKQHNFRHLPSESFLYRTTASIQHQLDIQHLASFQPKSHRYHERAFQQIISHNQKVS